MKKIILSSILLSFSVQAQIVTTTRIYQEPALRNVVPNPYPPSYWWAKKQELDRRTIHAPRVIISTEVQQVIPTGQISPQDQQIIDLIR